MKFRTIIMFILCMVCIIGGTASAFGNKAEREPVRNEKLRLHTLQDTIAALYEQGNSSHKQEVYLIVQSLKQQLNQPELLQHGTANAWIMMKSDVLAVEQGIIKGEAGIVWREPISRLRLAVDALLQSQQGPWLQYEALLLEDIKSIRRVSGSNRENTVELTSIYSDKLFERMRRMEIAAYMVGDEDVMSRLNKRAVMLKEFITTYEYGWNQEQQKRLTEILDYMELSVHALFAQADGSITVPTVTVPSAIPPTSFALFIGAIITGFLTFAGYRKYKQEPYGVKNWRV